MSSLGERVGVVLFVVGVGVGRVLIWMLLLCLLVERCSRFVRVEGRLMVEIGRFPASDRGSVVVALVVR